jgi:hypothetical protein
VCTASPGLCASHAGLSGKPWPAVNSFHSHRSFVSWLALASPGLGALSSGLARADSGTHREPPKQLLISLYSNWSLATNMMYIILTISCSTCCRQSTHTTCKSVACKALSRPPHRGPRPFPRPGLASRSVQVGLGERCGKPSRPGDGD